MLKTRDKALISLTALFQAAPGIRRGTVPVLHTVYGKNPLCKGPWGNFSLVFSRVKKLSKVLCSFDIVFLF